jgi:hypothetical protein
MYFSQLKREFYLRHFFFYKNWKRGGGVGPSKSTTGLLFYERVATKNENESQDLIKIKIGTVCLIKTEILINKWNQLKKKQKQKQKNKTRVKKTGKNKQTNKQANKQTEI